MTHRGEYFPSEPSASLPPTANEAEQGVLGCVLSDPGYCLPILRQEGIGPRHFYDGRYSALLALVVDMHRQGLPADDVLLWPRVQKAGINLEYSHLQALRDCTPSAANIEFYLPDLVCAAQRRQLIGMARQALAIGQENADIAQIRDTIDRLATHLKHSFGGDDLPPITTGAAALAIEVPEPLEIIEGVLHQGTKMALGGGSKSNKTWALLDAGISIAHGEPFWSRKTRKARALYVNLELPEWSFQRRLQAVRTAKHITEQNLLEIWHLRGHVAPYDVLLPKIRERIKAAQYGLVILDPIYKILGDLVENSSEDMTRLMNCMEALSVECGCAIIFGAHFSKGNQSAKESIDRISGSGVFARDPDTIMVMTRHEEEGAFTIETTLRNLKPVEPFVIRWDYPLFRHDENLDPSKLKQIKGRTAEFKESDILDVLPSGGLTTAEWQKTAQNEHGITRPTFYRLLKLLTNSRKINKINDKWEVSKVSNTPSETQ